MTDTLLNYAIIFGTGLVSTFALGFQSRNVNNGNFILAAATSFFIGVSSAYLWTHIPQGVVGGLVYGLSGSLGIVTAMYIHRKYVNER